MNPTIKAYYKAVTSSKKYIIVEDFSTNYFCYKYTATNNMEKWAEKSSFDCYIISTEYYYENLDVLQYLFNELNKTWTQYCYDMTWSEFLKRYELSECQYSHIKRLLKD